MFTIVNHFCAHFGFSRKPLIIAPKQPYLPEKAGALGLMKAGAMSYEKAAIKALISVNTAYLGL